MYLDFYILSDWVIIMLEKDYKSLKYEKQLIIFGTLLMTFICGYFFTTIGLPNTNNLQVFTAVQKLFNSTINSGSDVVVNKIILLLRMPRILLAILAGVGLAVAGAAMQSVARNYLVSPFTLGISSAAAFGASMCIVFGSGTFFQSDVGIIICAFGASCGCGLVVYGVSRQIGITPGNIVMVGIALNYLFSAMTATIEFFAKEHKLEAVVQWTFGTFNRATWETVALTGMVVLICFVLLMLYCLPLNAMAANDDETVKSLGINPEKIRIVCGLLAVFMTATIISFTGVIGFVGLIAPHMARFIIGNDHRYYLPFAGLLGGLLLLFSDAIGKFILSPVNIPVGIIVSFLGVPLFIHLILSKRQGV